MLSVVLRWIDLNVFALARELRLSYLPPLMIYVAAGISGLTGIVGTFFVKDYLGLSATFLAALAFWANIPWALKMPVGHLVDLIWRWKSGLVFLGAALIALSLLIMVGLLSDRAQMEALLPAEAWYVLSALLAPVGYVLQDVVADAMTVEAVPRVAENGQPLDQRSRKRMNTTVQTLGRVAIIGGSVFVALINLYAFAGAGELPEGQKIAIYREIYVLALSIPLISVAGVLLSLLLRRREARRLLAQGLPPGTVRELVSGQAERPRANWWILGGSIAFVAFTVTMGLGSFPLSQEIIFLGSFVIVTFLLARLTRELDDDARRTLIGTAVVIFIYRAVPGPGEGVTWWMIDELKFDQQFFSVLSLIGSGLTLAGMFIFRRFMAERSIAYVVGVLAVVGAVLSAPVIGMYYGLHVWSSAHTEGVVDARFIALVNTALESPLGQIAMIPMLAWIANSAPVNLKATYFAVMASFTNLALSLSQLGTKYLNGIFLVTREVRDTVAGTIPVPANYSELGALLLVQLAIGLALPMAAILFARASRFKSA